MDEVVEALWTLFCGFATIAVCCGLYVMWRNGDRKS